MRVLVTGATGYIGGRLVPALVEQGHEVHVLVRHARPVLQRAWADQVKVHEGDLLDASTLRPALDGIEVAYYLVHSMAAGGDFAESDRRAARNFADAASHVDHVIYLGGLLPPGGHPSEHLASRAEVGSILREHLPATEFRAGPIVGSGSGSFEMIRYLTERLPVMIAPRWVTNEVQPIAVRDVLAYLVAAAGHRPAGIVEIGGPDRMPFAKMMEVYADMRGLTRRIFPVPVLTPLLAGMWVGLVTPIPNQLAVPLIKGIIDPVLADTSKAERLFPNIQPIEYREAVERALAAVEKGEVETRWSSALGPGSGYEVLEVEGMVRETRTLEVDAPPSVVFDVAAGLGGEQGWPAWPWAWRLRGVLDQLIGGPGLARGRRDPDELRTGDVVDFWRVEEVERPSRIRMRAEMRLPGRAWLTWRFDPIDGGQRTRLEQVSLFAPKGLSGALYWWTSYPVHRPIFSRLAEEIAERAEAQTSK